MTAAQARRQLTAAAFSLALGLAACCTAGLGGARAQAAPDYAALLAAPATGTLGSQVPDQQPPAAADNRSPQENSLGGTIQ